MMTADLGRPSRVPKLSILETTSAPSVKAPNTVCFPSNQGHGTVSPNTIKRQIKYNNKTAKLQLKRTKDTNCKNKKHEYLAGKSGKLTARHNKQQFTSSNEKLRSVSIRPCIGH
jgi:hypothetical protein